MIMKNTIMLVLPPDPKLSIWSVLAKEDWATPYGILIVTGLGVALGIIIGFSLLTVALVCIKRLVLAIHNILSF